MKIVYTLDMKNVLAKRNQAFIGFLNKTLWPFMRTYFSVKIKGLENVPTDRPLLFISNHNSGAVLESHSVLFTLLKKLGKNKPVYGLTHPSIFKIPLMKHYFELIGAVPAAYEVSSEVFKNGHSLMIFPGGNRQALRVVWDYKSNNFLWAHGWAKIAIENNVQVIPVTFKGSHFINPVLLSGQWISKLLVLPALLGIKYAPISIGQIISALITFFGLKYFHSPLIVNIAMTYVVFIISPLVLVLPVPVQLTFYPALNPSEFKNQEELEESMALIMNHIYE